jgi:hypothetical protein
MLLWGFIKQSPLTQIHNAGYPDAQWITRDDGCNGIKNDATYLSEFNEKKREFKIIKVCKVNGELNITLLSITQLK